MPDRTDRSADPVLDAAIAAFARHGYAGTSIQMLVDACGRSRSSLYGTYGDKAGLFAAALERYVRNDPLGPPSSLDRPRLLARACLEMPDLPAAALPLVQSALEVRWEALRRRQWSSESDAVDVLAGQLGRSVLCAAGVDADLLGATTDPGRAGEDSP